MFDQRVYDSIFTSSEASMAFDNNMPISYRGMDNSFESTLRALLHHRIGKDTINVENKSVSHSVQVINSNSARDIIDSAFRNADETKSTVTVVNCHHTSDEARKALLNVYSHFPEYHNGYEPVERVSEFFKDSFEVICFVNKSLKSTVIVVDELNTARYHAIQCAIPAFLPWYFNEDDGITDTERKLLESLRKSDGYVEYINALREIYSSLNLREKIIRSKLESFDAFADKQRLEELIRQKNNAETRIKEYMRAIQQLIADKHNYDLTYIGIKETMKDKGSNTELMDYFLSNNRLSIVYADSSSITFLVKDYLTFFDEDAAESFIAERDSYFYYDDDDMGDLTKCIPFNELKRFWEKIFTTRELKLKMSAAYSIDGSSVESRSSYSSAEGYLPNPHIYHYDCLGDYRPQMIDCVERHDYVMLCEQCVASCRSLNITETCTGGHMVHDIMYEFNNGTGGNEIIELPSGESVTVKRALEYLNETEGTAE